MCKHFLCVLLAAFLCGCTATKQNVAGGTSVSEKKTPNLAKVVENEQGRWTLVAPDGGFAAYVYVQQGSALPDQYENGMIRIVDEVGKIGFANVNGEIQIPPAYRAATPFKGRVAAVVPASETQVSATDGEDHGTLTGNEKWGVIGKDGRFFRNPVFRRTWEEKVGNYVYTCPTSAFWIDEDGELHSF